jgi:DNA-binding MarR family transcriptional regulator
MNQSELVSEENPIVSVSDNEAVLTWLESVLPRIMRRLMDSENLDMPLLQLPLAQMRLAQALYVDNESAELSLLGETMGRLSERLGVRHNALTQAADRLVNHGLAERLSDPHDRRIVRLRLTGRGRSWVRERRDRRHAHLGRLWAILSDGERKDLLAAVRVLETIATRLDGNTSGQTATNSNNTVAREPHTVEETLSRFTAGAANGASAAMK